MIKCKLGAAAVVITPPNKLRMAAVKLPLPPLPNPIFKKKFISFRGLKNTLQITASVAFNHPI